MYSFIHSIRYEYNDFMFYLSGKASIDHYVTPVRAGRIILELGGYCEPEVSSDIDLIMTRAADNRPWY